MGDSAFSFQAENQNRSYVVRSTASFSVIEMPYKNLKSELPSNSTTVRDTHTNKDENMNHRHAVEKAQLVQCDFLLAKLYISTIAE